MKAIMMGFALAAFGAVSGATPLCEAAYATACCKICKKGKACGDSCISASSKCTKGKGCACNG